MTSGVKELSVNKANLKAHGISHAVLRRSDTTLHMLKLVGNILSLDHMSLIFLKKKKEKKPAVGQIYHGLNVSPKFVFTTLLKIAVYKWKC